jgi:hypothetical protein
VDDEKIAFRYQGFSILISQNSSADCHEDKAEAKRKITICCLLRLFIFRESNFSKEQEKVDEAMSKLRSEWKVHEYFPQSA